MTIELTYKFSKLDNEKQFGLVFNNDNPYNETYIRWVFYYLGSVLGEKKPRIYPFRLSDGKVIKEYKYCNDANRQAKLLANAINKRLS